LLKQDVPILDAVHAAGYFDQPHLARSVRHFIGQTPAGIARGDEQLSFLYKTTARETPMIASHDHFTIKDHLDRARS
jgi:AraC-like DNA-binding protein